MPEEIAAHSKGREDVVKQRGTYYTTNSQKETAKYFTVGLLVGWLMLSVYP